MAEEGAPDLHRDLLVRPRWHLVGDQKVVFVVAYEMPSLLHEQVAAMIGHTFDIVPLLKGHFIVSSNQSKNREVILVEMPI